VNDLQLRAWFYDRLQTTLVAAGVDPSQISEQGMPFNTVKYEATSSAFTGNPDNTAASSDWDDSKDYWVPYVLPNEPKAAALGTGARNEYTGAFQVTLYGSILHGEGELEHIAKMLPVTEAFKRGVTFSMVDQFCVYCNQSYIAYSGRDKDRWQIVARVKFRATIIN